MFTALIVKPLFNFLVLVIALVPGHNFGLALIIFTILVRLLLWPLLKKQLHQNKKMMKLQPEIKRIKKAAAGNKQKENTMIMELYKEKGVNPLGTLPILIVNLIILIGLNSGVSRIIKDPHTIVTFTYGPIRHLGFIESLSKNIHLFDHTLFKVVDLGRTAVTNGKIYYPALLVVLASAIIQYFQGAQLLPKSKDQRKLRDIMKSASKGEQADQTEINAAVGRGTKYLLPFMIFFVTIGLPAALSLYWFVGGLIAYMQQATVLKEDEEELEKLADGKKDAKEIPEAEIIEKKPSKTNNSKKTSNKKVKKRRK